jgi:hypothetical protein
MFVYCFGAFESFHSSSSITVDIFVINLISQDSNKQSYGTVLKHKVSYHSTETNNTVFQLVRTTRHSLRARSDGTIFKQTAMAQCSIAHPVSTVLLIQSTVSARYSSTQPSHSMHCEHTRGAQRKSAIAAHLKSTVSPCHLCYLTWESYL